MRNEKYGKQTFRTSSIFVLVLSLSVVGFTQDRRPDRGIQAANSYSISDIENVNLTNGNLMLNIPLASLPAGRGSGYTVALNYNSKLWNALQERRTDGIGQNPEDLYYFRELVAASDSGGWFLDSGGYRLKRINRLELEPEAPCMEYSGEAAYRRNGHIFKMELQMPDGGVREFHPYGVGTEAVGYPDGFYNVDPYGVQHQYSYSPPGPYGGHPTCSYSAVQVTTAGINYYTTDGSRLRLFLPYQPGVPFPLMRWTLYQPDGRIVENLPADDPNITQRMTDRNGNKLVWKPATLNGLNGFKIENEVGQYVFVSWNKVIQPGVNGEFLETTLQWDDIWVYKRHLATVAPNANYSFTHADLYQNLGVLEKIILPQQAGGREYIFSYHGDYEPPGTGNYTDGTGELESVTLPSGATAEYSYALEGDPMGVEMNRAITGSKVTSRVLTYDLEYDGQAQQVTETTGYGTGPGIGGSCSPDSRCQSQVSAVGGDLAGYAYRISQTGGSVTEKIWVNKRPMGGSVYALIEPFVKTEFNSVPDPNGNPTLTATKDLDYDQNGNILEIREYDWVAYSSVPRSSTGEVTEYLPLPRATGLPAGLTLKRRTINTYYYPTPNTLDPGLNNSPNHYSNPASPKLKNLLKSTEIQDGNGTTVSRTEFYYDGGMSAPDKGNLTEAKAWDSTKGAVSNPLTTANAISTTAVYDQYGNPTLTTDAKGTQTQITYGSVNGFTGLYPTQTIVAYQTPIARTSTAVYDFYTGVVTTATDVDNNVSVSSEYDALGRPTKVRAAAGTALESWTQTTYDDVNRRVTVKADIETIGDARKVATQFYDQLGRVRLAKTLEDAATQSATNETDGIKVQTRYKASGTCTFDPAKMCSSQLVSNPYRASTSSGASSEESMGWTLSQTQADGKHSELETFGGAALPKPFVTSGFNTNSTGAVKTDIDANAATVADQAGKKRRSITNGLGQLVRVDEPNDQGQLDVGGSPVQPTNYSYNALNNLTTVNQGSQTRTFVYSSLSRLTSETSPEAGTTNYEFDANGNLTKKTDARGVAANLTYDALNRPTQKSYTGESGYTTPTINFTYDEFAHAKGKLTKVNSSISETRYPSFDEAGRLTSSRQTTDGTDYDFQYAYNIAGMLTEETYPSGRKVKNVLDSSGDLSIVQSKKNANFGYLNYAKHFTYTPSGAVSSMQLGNGRWESTVFNSRLQTTQIGLGTVQNGTDKFDLDYSYGTTQNNGNIVSQDITVTRTGQSPLTFNQTYTYDTISRLKSAEEKTGTTTNWKQTYSFDRYGNRNFDTGNTTFPTVFNAATNPTANIANNRFSSGQGYGYDSAGNVTVDANGQTYVFDAENKQVSASNGSGNLGQYFFDGEERRVKKVIPSTGEVTVFVYSASGKLAAEYSTIIQSPTEAKVQYLTNDNLGTPRINTDANGEVVSRSDYLPYGEEIVGLGARSNTDKYVADDVRQGFTGYINDGETGLDFAQARMLRKGLGRFTGADPYSIVLEKEKVKNATERGKVLRNYISNPQVWNRYSYVLNSPLGMIDAGGKCSVPAGLKPGQTGICVEAYIAAKVVGTRVGGLVKGYGDDRGPSGTDATLTARVRVDIIVSDNGNGTHKYAWTWKTERSAVWVAGVVPITAQGTANVNVTPGMTESDGTSRASLSVDATNGFTGYGGPEGDIAFDLNLVTTNDGKVGLDEGSQTRTYPTLAIWRYSKDADGNVTSKLVKDLPEQNIEDLTKPKQPIAPVIPQ